jgi:glycosyltransferase involved in cell wall biosynthesis
MNSSASSAPPLVSVVIPNYNYGHYLPAAVRSALEQTGVDVDIVIVDDASTDGSDRIAKDIADSDERIRLVQHAVNRGHIATYNDGLAMVRGEYVVLLSADDLLAPGSLERSTRVMAEHPSVGLVYGYAPEFTDAPPVRRRVRAGSAVWSGSEWLERMCSRGTNILTNPEAIVRRDVMDRLGGYDPEMPHSADMDLWMRAAALADVGRVNGPDQAYYRVHAENMHLTDFSGLLTDMRARLHTFESFFAGSGSAVHRATALLDRARGSIASEALRYANSARNGGGAVGGASSAELMAFAAEVWPAISGSRTWRRLERAGSRPSGGLARYVGGTASRVRNAVLWRRWRRYGL